MARPTKQGIDYFPVDCDFDNKHEMYVLETGAAGQGILIELWKRIYSDEGYYINPDDDLQLLVARKLNVDIKLVNVCINTALKRNIFDQRLFDEYSILTSKAVQKRYLRGANRKLHVHFVSELSLIDVSAYKNVVVVGINSINVNAKHIKEKEKEKVKEKVNNNTVQNAQDEQFYSFWKIYPNKKAKKNAQKVWAKICSSIDDIDVILVAIRKQIENRKQLHARGQFVPEWPLPATWLNGERWNDELNNSENIHATNNRNCTTIDHSEMAKVNRAIEQWKTDQ